MASGGSTTGTTSKNDDSKWYFTAEQLAKSPSRICGMDADQELMYRQRAANLIQDMGQRLQVSQLCINTAIVYMHRFYAFHSFTNFHRNSIAAAALFLAAKVEEQPRKLEHIIKVVHICLGLEAPDPLRESYAEQAQDLVFNENVLLQTLGFDVAIDHPHTHVVKTCHLVKASKDLAQTSYFMASNSLHLTTMCLQYKPTVVACFCIHLACKWSRWEIPQSNEGRHWFHYVDKTVTPELLDQLTNEFLHIFDRCPTRLKNKMKSIRADQCLDEANRRGGSGGGSGSNSSLMAVPSSSSSTRGVDEGGGSSSSSSSSHYRPKQSANPDQLIKPHGMSSSGSHQKIPSSASSTSGSRSRPQQQSSSSGSSGGSSNSSSSSQSSQRSGSGYNVHDGSKNRQSSSSSSSSSGIMNPTAEGGGGTSGAPASGNSGTSSSMHSGYNQMKANRQISSSNSGGQKGVPINKPPTSSSSGSSGAMYSVKQQQQQQSSSLFSHPPSYNQSVSGRSAGGTTNLQSVTDPQQVLSGAANHSGGANPSSKGHSQGSSSESSSFRLLDESFGKPVADPMQMCTPPKQSKPSSIFSPDWKDSQHDTALPPPPPQQSALPSGKSRSSGHHGGSASGGGVGGDRMLKQPKGSPGGKKQPHHGSSQAMAAGSQGGSRSETPKKERHSQQSQQSKHQSSMGHDKKPSVPPPSGASLPMPGAANTSNSLKRALDGTLLHGPPSSGNDMPAGNGAASMAPSQFKRPHPSNEQIRQEDGTDFREQKVRKFESGVSQASSFLAGSPSDKLFNSSFDAASTFDKLDDSSSMFDFNDPGTQLPQQLLSDSKPSTLAKSGALFGSTINGIETNAAFVRSLLEESLFNETPKFGSLCGTTLGSSGTTDTTDTKPLDTLDIKPSLLDRKPSPVDVKPALLDIKPAPVDMKTSPMDVKPSLPLIGSLLQPATTGQAPPPQASTGDQQQMAGSGAAPPSYPWGAAGNANLTGDGTSNTGAPSIPSALPPAVTATTGNAGDAMTAATSDPDTDHGGHRSKSEKKKKKEKHKHKEKDKSKDRDREEKKKHKKDKDKHRDRDHHREKGDQQHSTGGGDGSGGSAAGSHGSQAQDQPPPGPIKIKLNRAIIPPVVDAGGAGGAGSHGTHSNSASNDGLKIKIPKDRLSGSSSLPPAGGGGGSAHPNAHTGSTGSGSSSSLKLKISKDKIEHYNISATSDPNGAAGMPQASYGGTGAGNLPAGGSMMMGGGLGPASGDRDKDREKGKSKSSASGTDHGARQNGSGGMAMTTGSSNVTGNSSSKSSNKVSFTLLIDSWY
ncbi:AGAP006678-PA-like protein [Anopheles sinensis]|uniref:AGAP006678-PA-like protein n=1 Tax=Anopheles sinensis TaxID=74873 RepID=A0A084WSX1_ANOSI|nr:AGAP006678-PA-like protein [Anopheles sinensis]